LLLLDFCVSLVTTVNLDSHIEELSKKRLDPTSC